MRRLPNGRMARRLQLASPLRTTVPAMPTRLYSSVKELKGFQRIHLAVGESKEVSFDITPDMLKFYNADLKHVIEPGDFQIMIGTNSKDVKTMKLNVK